MLHSPLYVYSSKTKEYTTNRLIHYRIFCNFLKVRSPNRYYEHFNEYRYLIWKYLPILKYKLLKYLSNDIYLENDLNIEDLGG